MKTDLANMSGGGANQRSVDKKSKSRCERLETELKRLLGPTNANMEVVLNSMKTGYTCRGMTTVYLNQFMCKLLEKFPDAQATTRQAVSETGIAELIVVIESDEVFYGKRKWRWVFRAIGVLLLAVVFGLAMAVTGFSVRDAIRLTCQSILALPWFAAPVK